MSSYEKFAKMQDSDDEDGLSKDQALLEDDITSRRRGQAKTDTWLKRRIVKLKLATATTEKQEEEWIYGTNIQWVEKQVSANSSGGSFDPAFQRPFRDVSSEERGALAMLLALCYFEEGGTNLHLHMEIQNLVGIHPWMEDPQTLELLCRIHNGLLQEARESGLSSIEESADEGMRKKLLSAVNVLAAPGLAHCSGGLREFMPQICTEKPSGTAKEWKQKYHQLDFAKEAIVTSMCPDLGLANAAERDAFCGLVGYVLLLILLLLVVGGSLYYLFRIAFITGGGDAEVVATSTGLGLEGSEGPTRTSAAMAPSAEL